MTTKQRMSILLDRWPAACKSQGWNKSDRALRLQVISQAVGREVSSMNDLYNSADIDKVYAHLGHLSYHVAATAESIGYQQSAIGNSEDPGYRRRVLWLIHKHSHPLGGFPYVLALARDKFHLVTGLSTIEDLTTGQLNQLMITLNSRKTRRQAKSASELSLQTENTNCPF